MIIARPGPCINAEVDGGGFPGWLSTTAGNTRTGDPEYTKWADQWQTRIDRIIARHHTSTGVDTTHIALDFNATPGGPTYTWDDPDPALRYAGSWSHVANQSYTGADYKNTESFSNRAGDSVTVSFTGTRIAWWGSKTDNHGLADVSIDGAEQTTVDDSGSEPHAPIYQATGLTDGPHTLEIVVTGPTARARPATTSRSTRSTCRRATPPRRPRTRRCRRSPEPRSRSTGATRTSSWRTTRWARTRCATRRRRS